MRNQVRNPSTLRRQLLILLLFLTFTALSFRPKDPDNSSISISEFGRLWAGLSEPEGYFDTDNFVSNEAAYLKVLPALKRHGVRGGAYLGVGPDQNFSYIAEARPEIAFILDIRRQNSIQHLYFKAIFQLCTGRIDFVERLFGRPLASERVKTESLRIGELLSLIDSASPNSEFAAKSLAETLQVIRSWHLLFTAEDYKTAVYIGQAFMNNGPDMKFTTFYRAPRPQHPTLRTLLEETDLNGAQVNYLAEEARYRVIKRLQAENRIIPVVGDFAGPRAFQSISRELERRELKVKCFYASNVEYYLFRTHQWPGYIRNLRSLPLAQDAYIIRSFANVWERNPAQLPGYYMSTVIQSLNGFLEDESAGRNQTYGDMVTRNSVMH